MDLGRLAHTNQTQRATLDELNKFNQYGFGRVANHSAVRSLRVKLGGNPARAHFICHMSDWLLDLSSYHYRSPKLLTLTKRQLPFIFEVIISIQYLHNQILDGKAGVTNKASIRANLLSANLLKEQLYAYINNEVPTKWRAEVEQSVRRIFQLVDIGQHYEQNYNTYQAWRLDQRPQHVIDNEAADLTPIAPFVQKIKKDLPVHLHTALDAYFERVYLTCAALFVEGARLIGKVLRLSDKVILPAVHFSTVYGVMRQLVNDNADWVPSGYGLQTNEKVVFDSFSDLRNGVLTLPLFFRLSQGDQGHIRQLLDHNLVWSSDFESQVFTEITGSNALFQSIQNTRVLGELAATYLTTVSPGCVGLLKSCEIVHWNKYLVPCLKHEQYKLYRKSAYSKRTKRLIKQLRTSRVTKTKAESSSKWSKIMTQLRPSISLPDSKQVRVAEQLIAQF